MFYIQILNFYSLNLIIYTYLFILLFYYYCYYYSLFVLFNFLSLILFVYSFIFFNYSNQLLLHFLLSLWHSILFFLYYITHSFLSFFYFLCLDKWLLLTFCFYFFFVIASSHPLTKSIRLDTIETGRVLLSW